MAQGKVLRIKILWKWLKLQLTPIIFWPINRHHINRTTITNLPRVQFLYNIIMPVGLSPVGRCNEKGGNGTKISGMKRKPLIYLVIFVYRIKMNSIWMTRHDTRIYRDVCTHKSWAANNWRANKACWRQTQWNATHCYIHAAHCFGLVNCGTKHETLQQTLARNRKINKR